MLYYFHDQIYCPMRAVGSHPPPFWGVAFFSIKHGKKGDFVFVSIDFSAHGFRQWFSNFV
jgi:hypothetical protein